MHLPMAYQTTYAPMLGHSSRMRAVRQSIEQVADTDATVLILGESGVGKEIVAKALHAASPRGTRPFVKVNCAALPSELLESELFGHEKGPSPAYRSNCKFELHGGTICLDEIATCDRLQASLQILKDHDSRASGLFVLPVDVRVIAATNRNLESAVRSGEFREDLYYRLKVVTLQVPPLRERKEEIPILARTFVRRFNEENGRQVTLSAESLRLLGEYSWPGNIRELENMITRWSCSSEDSRRRVPSLMTIRVEPETTPPPAPIAVARAEGPSRCATRARRRAKRRRSDPRRPERVHGRARARAVCHRYKALRTDEMRTRRKPTSAGGAQEREARESARPALTGAPPGYAPMVCAQRAKWPRTGQPSSKPTGRSRRSRRAG